MNPEFLRLLEIFYRELCTETAHILVSSYDKQAQSSLIFLKRMFKTVLYEIKSSEFNIHNPPSETK